MRVNPGPPVLDGTVIGFLSSARHVTVWPTPPRFKSQDGQLKFVRCRALSIGQDESMKCSFDCRVIPVEEDRLIQIALNVSIARVESSV